MFFEVSNERVCVVNGPLILKLHSFLPIFRILPKYGQRRVQQRSGLEYVGRQPRKRFGGGVRRHGQTACVGGGRRRL